MKVLSAEFEKSAFSPGDWPMGGRPEIAFLGRSNVGKSSLINSLLLRKGLARTSNTPGRTQSINFFLINERCYFVDLPGYGFARVSKQTRQDWGKMAGDYMAERRELTLCIHLVDARHRPSALDIQLHEWLTHHSKRHIAVATKADKLSNNELRASLAVIEKALAGTAVVPYSSRTGLGRDRLLSEIAASLA